jgi:hypothetical protein
MSKDIFDAILVAALVAALVWYLFSVARRTR